MPATKLRTRIIAQNFISSSGMYRDITIPWQNVYLASASINGAAASQQIIQVGGSQTALRMAFASQACPIWLSVPVPQDVALRGETAAAGSGLLFVDWTDITNAGGVTVWGASVFHVPPGSAIGDAGTSTLGAAASTTFSAATASELNQSNALSFNAPVNRNGQFALRFVYHGQNASNTTASDFGLFGFRLRYLADRIGS